MGCRFAELDWGGLLDARADMYIVVVAEMAAKEARLRWGSKRLSTGASREAPVDNDCFGYWARPDPLAIGSWAGQV